MDSMAVNIEYKIVGRDNQGLWVIKGFYADGRPTGSAIYCSDAETAWGYYLCLNGITVSVKRQIYDLPGKLVQ